MASVNKVIIIGNLGRDPETRYMSNGDAVTNVSIATTENWRDKNSGEKRELTEWHRITFYRKLAQIVKQYLKKGSQIYIEGRLQTRKWTNKEGVEKYITEVIADNMQMLGSRKNTNEKNISNNLENNFFNIMSARKNYTSNTNNEKEKSKENFKTQPLPISNFLEADDDVPF
ncbi:single-stranded DNA-binding protein [Candidatus Profftella armatura]|uniref:Single-stranded DNA-binding protein n=1 Tax=Candidatus Profftella armatura TaxID=669502 RepID=S5RPZ6_9PROT|nr:single-stranded DNA-binding protein [Candidatus Profftella armatura]AGS06953.1 single-stranded DNA-binding protein [Candidatus Profftella armatura]ALC96026.1 single-stranded DNA-binding protein [Candidatus Profftella armatura]QLK13855.1 single-stranded DNA-binding protein [Candidatus Profftella armatura]